MGSKRISELTETVNITDDNVIPIVSGGATQKVKFATLNEKFKGEKGDKGADGNGILTIEQTERVTGSDADNVVKIVTTDGAVRNIYIKNGSQGEKGDKGDAGEITNIDDIVKQIKPLVLDSVHPIGSIFITMDDRNPSDILGVGTWERIANGKTLWGGDGTNTGAELEAGIPNIKGSIDQWDRGLLVTSVDGAFKMTTTKRDAYSGTWGSQMPRLDGFDASLCSTVYKDDCDTVQPPAIVVNMWRRIA